MGPPTEGLGYVLSFALSRVILDGRFNMITSSPI